MAARTQKFKLVFMNYLKGKSSMVSSNQLFIRVPNGGSSFFMPFSDLREVICSWPVVAEKDENLKLSVAYGGERELPQLVLYLNNLPLESFQPQD